MIYGRFGTDGNAIEIVRVATLADVFTLDHRKADAQDHECLAAGSYVVVRYVDEPAAARIKARPLRLYHRAYLRADGGASEIDDAIAALGTGDDTASP